MIRTFDDFMATDLVKAPGNLADETIPATYLDLYGMQKIVFLVAWGALDADDTIDLQVVQATSSAGAGSKNITGAVVTQVVDTHDNKFLTIEVDGQALDVDGGFRYVALAVNIAGATAMVGCIFAMRYRGEEPVVKPAAYKEAVVVV